MNKARLVSICVAVVLPVAGIVTLIVCSGRCPAPVEGPTPTGSGTPAVARAVGQGTAVGGDQLPSALVQKLSDLQTRAATARLLGEQKDRRAGPYLRTYCSDPDTTVRLNSIWALGEINDTRGAMEISTRTADPDPEVRLAAAVALSKLVTATDPAEAVISGLTDSLKSEDVKIRLTAAQGLAKCNNEVGLAVLVDLLGHADPVIGKGAEEGLRGVGEAMVPTLIKALAKEATLRNVRLLALFKKKEAGSAFLGVVQLVCADARSGSKPRTVSPMQVSLRQACVDGLVAIGPEIIPVLDEQVIQGRCPLGVKMAGADVMKAFGSAAVAPIAQRIITREIFPEELELKLWIDTLGEIGDPAAAPALSSALTKPVADKEFYRRTVEEAARKIEAKTGKKLALMSAVLP